MGSLPCAGAGISTTAAVRGAAAPTPMRTWRTAGSVARHAIVSRSEKWVCTQSAMNCDGSSSRSVAVSGSKLPSAIGRSQPSKVRAPQSRRRLDLISSQDAGIESSTSSIPVIVSPVVGVPCTQQPPFRSSTRRLPRGLCSAQTSPARRMSPRPPRCRMSLCIGPDDQSRGRREKVFMDLARVRSTEKSSPK
jgi:hypothetical protein